jgi:hypothetical protein
MKKIILVTALFFGFNFTVTSQQIFLLKNKLPGTYLHIEGGKLQTSSINPNQQSAQWQFVDAGAAQFRIKNLEDGTFLNIENGFACTDIQDNWWSAIWKVKKIEGSNLIEISNLWYPNRYINMQEGLDCSEITGNPLNATWEYEVAATGFIYKDGGPSQQLSIAAENPAIIPVYNNDALSFAFNHKDDNSSHVMISSYKKQGDQFRELWTKAVPNSLNKLGGFTTDGTNYYCLTVKEEDLSNDPSVNTYRNNVVRLVKLDKVGNEIWTKEINNKTYLTVPVYSPLIAGTGGLAYGNGMVTMVFAKNTEWDNNINTRHQTAVFITVNASTGEPTKPSEEVSWRHSFDQRVIFDGHDFVFADLGDPGFMPAAGIAIRKVTLNDRDVKMPDPMYFWSHGAYIYARQGSGNSLFTSLGNIVSGNNGYTVLFSSVRKNVLTDNEPRNLAMVHVVKNFETIKDGMDNGKPVITNFQRLNRGKQVINITGNMVDTKTKNPHALKSYSFTNSEDSKKSATQSGLVWLTDYHGDTNFTSVERPKLVQLSNGQFLALWEEWTFDKVKNNQPKFSSTKCMLIDDYGNILKAASKVPARLNPNGADLPFVLERKAAWITREEVAEPFNTHTNMWEFNLHVVDEDLGVKSYLLSNN